MPIKKKAKKRNKPNHAQGRVSLLEKMAVAKIEYSKSRWKG
jgi:hypothetical protein